MKWIRLLNKSFTNSFVREEGKHTQTRSCVITTSACWQAACRAEPGSRSANSDLEERARLRGALMSSLVQWAKRSSSLGRLCSITANRRRPDSVMSGPSPGVGGGNGATNSFCSYLALIHDSRSSLNKQRKIRKWRILGETHLQQLLFFLTLQLIFTRDKTLNHRGVTICHIKNVTCSSLPWSIRCWFAAAQCARLPYTVHHVVADGTENQRELSRQIVKV